MTKKKRLSILIVGGGMYTIGRGTEDYGTIVPAVFEACHLGYVENIVVATTNQTTAEGAAKRIKELSSKMHIDIKNAYYPKTGRNDKAYLTAAKELKPDVAIISVPDHLHAEVAIPLMELGIHCLVVKPFVPTVAEAKNMALIAEKYKVVAEVEFHKRLDESNIMLKDVVSSRRLGTLLYAVIEYSQQKCIPCEIFQDWVEKTNIFQYLGVHYVDLICFLTGYNPVRVTAWGQKSFLSGRGIDSWDSMQVVVEWDNGNDSRFVSTHITNWIDPNESSAMSDQKINVVGTCGRYQADQKNRGVQIVTDGIGVRDENPYFSRAFVSPSGNRLHYRGYGIENIIQFFRDVIQFLSGETTLEELDETRPTFNTSISSTAVVEAALESLLHDNVPIEITL